ncbi:hypothetical protein CABS01_13151 [Colletotrichum abscissum]|uniref:Uncharacterized protein n=1 Tax=Colletotrichum abscissum TaxID=1671311 RepID=A0A9P9XIZ9_9PEZI|nr:uncharacterized protein CABS01_13151 [Colletotrichum abscissum]KAI3554067.1 hypothetical protein CABS02_05787 [Colletotrichum abscissum]KAK1486523.1 hypothetical protein CABS01_13151 [Colletotrichum abscissum]
MLFIRLIGLTPLDVHQEVHTIFVADCSHHLPFPTKSANARVLNTPTARMPELTVHVAPGFIDFDHQQDAVDAARAEPAVLSRDHRGPRLRDLNHDAGDLAAQRFEV